MAYDMGCKRHHMIYRDGCKKGVVIVGTLIRCEGNKAGRTSFRGEVVLRPYKHARYYATPLLACCGKLYLTVQLRWWWKYPTETFNNYRFWWWLPDIHRRRLEDWIRLAAVRRRYPIEEVIEQIQQPATSSCPSYMMSHADWAQNIQRQVLWASAIANVLRSWRIKPVAKKATVKHIKTCTVTNREKCPNCGVVVQFM